MQEILVFAQCQKKDVCIPLFLPHHPFWLMPGLYANTFSFLVIADSLPMVRIYGCEMSQNFDRLSLIVVKLDNLRAQLKRLLLWRAMVFFTGWVFNTNSCQM